MRKPKITYDILLFSLMMVFLFTPIIQEWTGLFSVKALKGVIEPTPKPKLTFETYKSNTYQTQMEKYVSEHFGMREPVIRLYNQYLWIAYNKTYCHFIMPGKHGYLFYTPAVNEYFGNNLLKHYKSNEEAKKNIESELRQMNKLRHVLKEYDIEFLAFIAPDKPKIYPEYLPRCNVDTTTIHLPEYFARRMEEMGFPYINMTDWFVSMKDTVPFPLFPKTDSHWRYSAVYGYDSLFRFINALDGESKFPNLHIGPPIAYESEELEGDEGTLNLMFRIPGDKTRYKSDITIEADTIHRKPKVLFVGDSFIWSMGDFMPVREIMSDMEIWFYNSTAFEGFENKTESVKDIDRLCHILNADYVVFYSAGHQWWRATYGFAKDALLQLCVNDSLFEATVTRMANEFRNLNDHSNFTEQEIRDKMINRLKNDPELIPGLEGESVPSIRNTDRIEKALAIKRIRNDNTWFNTIQLYAAKNAMSIDDALQEEACRMAKGKSLLRDEIVFDTASFIQMKKQEIIKRWKLDTKIMQMLQEKSEERNQPLEVTMEQDAQWVVNNQIEKGELFQ